MPTQSRNRRIGIATLATLLLTTPLLFGAAPAQADSRRDNDRQRHEVRRDRYTPPQRIFKAIPREHDVVRYRNRDYYRHRGHYYVREPRGYVMVTAPVGALVISLPAGHISVVIGNHHYFVAAGVYYRPVEHGYVVVRPPAPAAGEAVVPTGRVVVNVGRLNVRQGPGYDFAVIAIVARGASLTTYGTAPGWLYVRSSDGRYGWVSSNLVVPLEETPQG